MLPSSHKGCGGLTERFDHGDIPRSSVRSGLLCPRASLFISCISFQFMLSVCSHNFFPFASFSFPYCCLNISSASASSFISSSSTCQILKHSSSYGFCVFVLFLLVGCCHLALLASVRCCHLALVWDAELWLGAASWPPLELQSGLCLSFLDAPTKRNRFHFSLVCGAFWCLIPPS